MPGSHARAIRSPALVIVGDHDVMAPESAVQLAGLIPHAELAVMPGSGHGAYLGAVDGGRPQHPGIAAAMIERFLAR